MNLTERLAGYMQRCHEEVTRKGECQPCDKPAVALRNEDEGDVYPVCGYHARGHLVTLERIIQTLAGGR